MPVSAKPLYSYTTIDLTSGSMGRLDVFADDLRVQVGTSARTVRRSHVLSVSKLADLGLSKVRVAFSYLDMLGDKVTQEFGMRENEMAGLKKVLGK